MRDAGCAPLDSLQRRGEKRLCALPAKSAVPRGQKECNSLGSLDKQCSREVRTSASRPCSELVEGRGGGLPTRTKCKGGQSKRKRFRFRSSCRSEARGSQGHRTNATRSGYS